MLLRHPLLKIIPNHAAYYPTPINLSYAWGFGSLAMVVLASQVGTGVLLAMHYSAASELAFASIEHIMRDVNNGWLIRYLHANGASFFFLTVYLHIARTLYYGFYTRHRQLLWSSGVVIFFLMMAIAFMGYVLPWGQMSFWGATVITNLFSALPFVGPAVAQWLWGGFSVANATLVRFFSLHYLLPFLLVGLVLLHFLLLHQNGSYNPLGILKTGDKITFYPYFYVKDYFGFVVFCVLVFFIIGYYPDVLGHSDNYIEANALVTPTHIVPEWYFLPFYAILRSIPNKLGGVILMALAILILLILPFYQTPLRSGYAQSRLLYSWLCWCFFFCVAYLGHLGGQPIEEPYIIFSQMLTVGYFCFFTAIVFVDYVIMFRFYRMNTFLSGAKIAVDALPLSLPFSKQYSGWVILGEEENGEHASFFVQTLNNNTVIPSALFVSHKDTFLKTLSIKWQHYRHPYHLVNASPWPFLISFALLAITTGFVLYFHQFTFGGLTMLVGFCALLFIMACWFRDVIREATFEGWHTTLVQRGLKMGMVLFIVSEVMFFFSFFWGFFHSSLAPAIQIGGIWPPLGIHSFDPWDVPFLNTLILLTSGVSVTWAHYAIRTQAVRWALPLTAFGSLYGKLYVYYNLTSVAMPGAGKPWGFLSTLPLSWLGHFAQLTGTGYVKNLFTTQGFSSFISFYSRLMVARWLPTARFDLLLALLVTIALGVIFTIVQFYEYLHAPFTISDSVYGSTFFLTTGFHGMHVLVGTLFLIVCFERARLYHFSQQHHVGLESAIWYWHFVDVVWLGLYLSVYHWGSAAL
jgi:quinol-cytochrome oxidoreductase complex cytochrome b subunit